MTYEVKLPYCDPRTYDDAYDATEAIVTDSNYIDNLDVNIDESLDEAYGMIEICGREYYASRILYELNEDEYDEYAQQEREERANDDQDWVAEQIQRLSEGEETSFGYGITVKAIEDPEDEDDEQGDEDLHCVLDFE